MNDIDLAIAVAEEGAAVVRRRFGTPLQRLDKGGGDFATNAVHFAAGLAICEAAGCVLTDLRGRAWDSGATGLIAAADSGTHAALLGLVGKQ